MHLDTLFYLLILNTVSSRTKSKTTKDTKLQMLQTRVKCMQTHCDHPRMRAKTIGNIRSNWTALLNSHVALFIEAFAT